MLGIVLLFGFGCAKNSGIDSVRDATPNNKEKEGEINSSKTDVKPEDLYGGWQVIKGQTTNFDSIIFNDDGTYNSHLNERPLEEGNWQIKNNTLFINPGVSGNFNMQFTGLELTDGKLLLRVGPIYSTWKKFSK